VLPIIEKRQSNGERTRSRVPIPGLGWDLGGLSCLRQLVSWVDREKTALFGGFPLLTSPEFEGGGRFLIESGISSGGSHPPIRNPA